MSLIVIAIFLIASSYSCTLYVNSVQCSQWKDNKMHDESVLGRKVNKGVIARDYFAGIINMYPKQFTKIDTMLDELFNPEIGMSSLINRCNWGGFVARASVDSDEWLLVTSSDINMTTLLQDEQQLKWVSKGRFKLTKYTSSPGDSILFSYNYSEGCTDCALLNLSFH